VGPVTTVATSIHPCPSCRTITGVRLITGTSPRVRAWSCTACRTNWAITVANPQSYFDRLTATVEQLGATRSVLRAVITLADDTATLPDTAAQHYFRSTWLGRVAWD
jgi:ribosomal protein L37AE/L43A